MPFRTHKVSLASISRPSNECRIVREKNGTFSLVYQNPTDVELPPVGDSNLGTLLEAGAELKAVPTTSLFVPSQHSYDDKDDLENGEMFNFNDNKE